MSRENGGWHDHAANVISHGEIYTLGDSNDMRRPSMCHSSVSFWKVELFLKVERQKGKKVVP